MVLCRKCNKETLELFPEEQGEYEIVNYCFKCECSTREEIDYTLIEKKNRDFLEKWNKEAKEENRLRNCTAD